MSLSKLFKRATSFVVKISFMSKNCASNIIHNSRKHKLISYVILSSASVIGVSMYVANNSNISCNVNDSSCEIKTPPHEVVDSGFQIIIKKDKHDYSEAINKSRDLLQRLKDEVGAPGIVIGVSVDGEPVWKEGIGYSDVENRVPCSKDTVMRIASISKSITMAAVAKLWEQGKLDLDKPVQDYLPYFPLKTFDGKPVVLTCRQLVSHLGGIRHYDNKLNNDNNYKNQKDKNNAKKQNEREIPEFEFKEYYIKEKFKDVKSAIEIFKDDPLVFKPGSRFHYSTFGWTVISAIVEAVAKEQFTTHMTKLFLELGMTNTYLDVNDKLIYHRSRNYIKDKKGLLINAPYVDNSHKWAGGGFLSTVGDLLQFSNAMLYSFQFNTRNLCDTTKEVPGIQKNVSKHIGPKTSSSNIPVGSVNAENVENNNKQNALPGYLRSKTIKEVWTPVTDAKKGKYGMGWQIFPEKNDCEFCEKCNFFVLHSGGAIGASSVVLILPKTVKQDTYYCDTVPKGTIVAILVNMQSIPLGKIALKVAQIFDQTSPQ